jgi:hypothetical protein
LFLKLNVNVGENNRWLELGAAKVARQVLKGDLNNNVFI